MKSGQRTVLLVEDETPDAILIERSFKQARVPAKLVRLKNGDEAVDYLQGAQPYDDRSTYPLPDAMLVDIKLPRRSGLEVIAWIRGHATSISCTPVIVLTSSRQRCDIDHAYKAGANAYMAKPATARELTDLLVSFQDYWMNRCELPDTSDTSAEETTHT
jgi:CheY-like chemotaxis protein